MGEEGVIAINPRQTNLFTAEDWTVVYQAFQQVNFVSYDFDSIRTVLIEYIRINYPEDFNDWIESSEFVAIIDLLAYVGQSLAFRMDLNTRENFLDTAESRDSILRLARMLSYTPQRNFPGFGLVKIQSIQTNEPLLDSENINLSGIAIDWNSATNTDWLEQFLLILNSALNPTNPFGTPVKKGEVSNIPTEIYELNNILGANVVFPFKTTVSGLAVAMEIVNGDFEDLGTFSELEPDPFKAFRVIYRNDGAGNDSLTTGFFLPVKQGDLQFQDIELSIPLENRLIDINIKNINQSDVWFQEINELGQIITEWTQVPTVAPSSNIIFNAIDKLERDIFTVLPREEDQISYRFADGRFGNIPQGIYRSWYRVSNGLPLKIKPQDIQDFTVTIPYTNTIGQAFNLTFTYSLEVTIDNATATESIADIKLRAPQLFYTQDRMVNGEDYNVFPLIKSSNALKIKATNRTYSGHSRFININDPTGTIQNTNVFSDDGIFYREIETIITELSRSSSFTASQIISDFINPALASTELENFVTEEGVVATNFDLIGTQRLFWQTTTEIANGSTGFFEQNSVIRLIGTGQLDPYWYMKEDALINIVLATDSTSDGIWIKITSLTNNGNGNLPDGTGTVIVNERLDDNVWIVKQVIPVFSTSLTTAEEGLITEQIDLKNTFGLGYDFVESSWYIIESQDLAPVTSDYDRSNAEDKSGLNLDESWLLRVEYNSASWKFYSRGLTYIWESEEDVRFFFDRNYRTVNIDNGQAVSDEIRILKSNSKPTSNDPLETDLFVEIDDSFVYPDGYIEPRRIKVKMRDADQDGTQDDPQVFVKIVGAGTYIFWKRTISIDGYEYLVPFDIPSSQWQTTTPIIGTPGVPPNPVDDDIVFVFDAVDKTVGVFWQFDADQNIWINVSTSYEFNAFGRTDLIFQWKHFVDREDRVDPSLSNIIDIFVLTTTYDEDFRVWLLSGASILSKPKPATSDTLRLSFNDIEDFKMISDQLIWRAVKYKILFGDQAEEELKASFKVVKNNGVSISDNEIKSRIINLMEEYFAIVNWDFGETFFYTELAAFIHQRMATIISSIVIVPLNAESAFGNLFQVKSEPDELFISGATPDNIQIVENLTVNNLRIGN